MKDITNTLEITKKAEKTTKKLSKKEKEKEIIELEKLMKEASGRLDFEQAIILREQIRELKGN